MDNVTHHFSPMYNTVGDSVKGVMACRYCKFSQSTLRAMLHTDDPTQHVCRAAVDLSGVRLLLPREWEYVKNIRVMDADGWGIPLEGWPAVDWSTAIPEEEFDLRASHSTIDMPTRD